MKAQMLKMAGVKSESAFYKKYPTQEAFMKVHGKEFKKAQMGAAITGGSSGFKPINYSDQFDQADKMITGSTAEERQLALEKAQAAAAAQKSSGGGFDIGGLMKMFGSAGGEGMGDMASSLGGARYGTAIPRAQFGGNYNLGQAPNFQTGDLSSGLNQTAPYRLNSPTPMIPEFNAYNPQGDQANTKMAKGIFEGANSVAPSPFSQENGWTKTSKALGKYAGPAGDIIGGIGALKQEKEAAEATKQTKLVSDVSLQAAQSTDVDAPRQRSEQLAQNYNNVMQVTTGESRFPVLGVGTNILSTRNGGNISKAQYGTQISGNPSEIQNTYDPYDIYTDSGYEPLNDSNVKQYYHGGKIHQMQDGGGMPWGMISQKATGLGQSLMGGQNAGGQIGGTAGKALGTAFGGPVGGAIGEFVGGIAGNALDPYAKRIKKDNAATQRNMFGMASVNMAKGIQSQNQSYMEDGGWVSNDWQPQVIASFGGLDEQEIYDYAHEGMDTLRAGGHLRDYTPPSDRAMEIYKDGGEINSYGLGGELQTHWGGGAETISHNPYLPGTGETVMFRGKSHEEYSPNGETGIGVTYGGNPVEVERGEPMVELEEGGVVDPMTGEVQKSGVVFGNLKIPNQYIDMLGDKNAKGKKFKNYVADLSKIESKQNTLIDKSSKELTSFTPKDSFDKLKLSALQASIQGANMKLKDVADKKINAASLQNAINDTAEENGFVADDLARGKVKIDKEAQKQYAKFGGKFTKAQDGIYKTKGVQPGMIDYNELGTTDIPYFANKETYEKTWLPKMTKALDTSEIANQVLTSLENYTGQDAQDVKEVLSKLPSKSAKLAKMYELASDYKPGPFHNLLNSLIDKTTAPEQQEGVQTGVDWTSKTPAPQAEKEEVDQMNPYINAFNQMLPYIRPSDQEELDAAQLYPEMYAMATNQLEPVQANFYHPELSTPYDISRQAAKNDLIAQTRAAQRQVGYNPAAQAMIAAQSYGEMQKLNEADFLANQAMKDKVYTENRATLNDAKLKNLAIADQQYTRQSEAKSNTKATTQAALNSIADKYAKNKLENRQLRVMENMYNYRYDSKGRAINMNPLQYFNMEGNGKTTSNTAPEGYEYETILKKKKEDKARNGSIVKSYKNL